MQVSFFGLRTMAVRVETFNNLAHAMGTWIVVPEDRRKCL